jgi:hypothetical protein
VVDFRPASAVNPVDRVGLFRLFIKVFFCKYTQRQPPHISMALAANMRSAAPVRESKVGVVLGAGEPGAGYEGAARDTIDRFRDR